MILVGPFQLMVFYDSIPAPWSSLIYSRLLALPVTGKLQSARALLHVQMVLSCLFHTHDVLLPSLLSSLFFFLLLPSQ